MGPLFDALTLWRFSYLQTSPAWENIPFATAQNYPSLIFHLPLPPLLIVHFHIVSRYPKSSSQHQYLDLEKVPSVHVNQLYQ